MALLTLFIYTPSRVESTGIAKAIVTSRFSQDSLTDQWQETGKGTTPTGIAGHGDAMALSMKALSSKLLPRVADFLLANSSYFDQMLMAKRSQGEPPGYAMRPPEIPKYAKSTPTSKYHLPPPSAQLGGERWAVVIGISSYKDSRIPSLRYAASDAQAFYKWLISPEGGNYDHSQVKLLLNEKATGTNIKDALFDWLQQPIEEDVIAIYFAGHGSSASPDFSANLFLLPWDAEFERIEATGFPMWDIETALKRFIKAKKTIIIADACHSGGIGESFDITRRSHRGIKVNQINAGLEDLTKVGDGVCVITASDENQYSQEDEKWGSGHGVFTFYLLKGLAGEADYDKNSSVTIGELIPFLSEKVRRATKSAQCPKVSGNFDPALTIGR